MQNKVTTGEILNTASLLECCQCGACSVVCTNIVLQKSETKYLTDFAPKVKNRDRCLKCKRKRCLSVCPVHEPQQEKLSWITVERECPDSLDTVKKSLLAHASNPTTQLEGASGGVVTALVGHLLQEGIATGALVARHNRNGGHWGQSILVKSRGELVDTSSSVYTPVPFNASLLECLENSSLKIVVVGRPCQLRALAKLEKQYPELENRIVCKIGLFCSWQISSKAMDFLFSICGEGDHRDSDSIAFREGKWPGELIFSKEGNRRSFPFNDPNSSNGCYFYPLTMPFIPQTCAKCSDALAECADIAVGDPWNLGVKPRNTSGLSLVLIRSDRGWSLFKEASKEGKSIKEIEDVSRAQIEQAQGATIELKRCGAFVKGHKCRPVKKDTAMFVVLVSVFGALVNRFPWPGFHRLLSRLFLAITWGALRKRLNPELYVGRED